MRSVKPFPFQAVRQACEPQVPQAPFATQEAPRSGEIQQAHAPVVAPPHRGHGAVPPHEILKVDAPRRAQVKPQQQVRNALSRRYAQADAAKSNAMAQPQLPPQVSPPVHTVPPQMLPPRGLGVPPRPHMTSVALPPTDRMALKELVKCPEDYPPIWRKAFALAENVRFTRTPDIEIIRKRAKIDPAYAKQLQAIYEMQTQKRAEIKQQQQQNSAAEKQPIQETAATAQQVMPMQHNGAVHMTSAMGSKAQSMPLGRGAFGGMGQISQISRSGLPEVNVMPATLVQSPAQRPERETMPLHTAHAIHIDEDNEAVAKKAVQQKSVHQAVAISDFAFFEFGPFSLDNLADPVEEGEAFVAPIAEEADAPEGSIADLFRVLECRFSKNTDPAASEVVEPDTVEDSVAVVEDMLQSGAVTQPEEVAAPVQAAAAVLAEPATPNVKVEAAPAKPAASLLESVLQATVAPKAAPVGGGYSMTLNFITANTSMGGIKPVPAFVPTSVVTTADSGANDVSDMAARTAIEVGDHSAQPQMATKAAPVIEAETAVEAAAPVATEVEEAKEEKTAPAPATKAVTITPRHVSELQSGITIQPRKPDYDYDFPSVDLLQPPVYQDGAIISQETLERSAGLLESVLEDFGIKGEIIHVRPGPVVTLYEFEPAPGVKSSRVIGLSDDIARSMSAISARVAVIPGRNVIGIELPNAVRETVFMREIVQSKAFETTNFKLALALGKNIGGEPVIAELAKMPHLLVAGTTGSGKSVAINTMILSLLYRMTPDQCRLIMVDPKMLELSIYDGIPHLLTPVVTDPKKAVTALKWAVREMEDRYRKMAKLGVRNIDGFNQRVTEALKNGETIMCTVQAGFDKETGELLYNEEAMDLNPLPYIVIVVDEMADLMMVAGKEIEGAIQRLAQMARAAGIHLIMATQRPSVDVITGTIKANFPTRISFQVTSKIDSRTILGEQGAETLLGQGDMLHMAGGGRIVRVHGAFVSDSEVENIVAHLKMQGTPDYLATVTDGEDEEVEDDAAAVADVVANGGDENEELYLQAVKVVKRDKKCSTSYIQRRLGIGYNKAATLVERMEEEGLVGAANHVGKREILLNGRGREDD